jgi:Tfp pilus assembly protein PilN
MTKVNLLPREIRQAQRTQRQTAVVAVLGAVAVGIVLFLWFLQGVRLSDLDDKVAAQESTNAELQSQVNELQRFQQLRADLEARRRVVQSVLGGGIAWSGVLRDVSLVIPERMWLTGMTGTLGATAAAAETGVPAGPVVATVAFEGDALDTESLALWLTRLETVHGWVNSWLTSAQKTPIGSTPVYVFQGSIDIASPTGGRS